MDNQVEFTVFLQPRAEVPSKAVLTMSRTSGPQLRKEVSHAAPSASDSATPNPGPQLYNLHVSKSFDKDDPKKGVPSGVLPSRLSNVADKDMNKYTGKVAVPVPSLASIVEG